MIHIITIHHKETKWLEIQPRLIDRYIENQHLHAFYNFDKPVTKPENFTTFEPAPVMRLGGEHLDHAKKLTILTDNVITGQNLQPDDIIVWMDSDAFPIANITNFIHEKLSEYKFIAVNRPENGDVIPHPSFACTTVGFYVENQLNWEGIPGDKSWRNVNGLHDPGGVIYRYLHEKNITWYKLTRTRSLTTHPVLFTIYDGLIYHHGCGSRKVITRCSHKLNDLEGDNERIFNKIYDFTEGNVTTF